MAFRVFAHRGASATHPENTLPAFEEALDCGSYGIELDVRASADGKIMVIHDATLERTTNGKGKLVEQTAQQLATYDAGQWFGEEFFGTSIPLLDDIFDILGGKLFINVEIKQDWTSPSSKEFGCNLLSLIQRHALWETTVVSAFDHRWLCLLRSLDVRVNLSALYEDIPTLSELQHIRKKIGRLYGVHLNVQKILRHLEKASISKCKEELDFLITPQNLPEPVLVWTVDDLSQARLLKQRSFAGIFTNDPRKISAGV